MNISTLSPLSVQSINTILTSLNSSTLKFSLLLVIPVPNQLLPTTQNPTRTSSYGESITYSNSNFSQSELEMIVKNSSNILIKLSKFYKFLNYTNLV